MTDQPDDPARPAAPAPGPERGPEPEPEPEPEPQREREPEQEPERGRGGAGTGTGPENGTGNGRDAGPDAPGPRLARGRDQEKVLAGVCAGAGRYFGVDPVIFRIVLVVLSLTGGIGLILYGLGWLVVPQRGRRESEAQRLLSGRIEGAPLTAVLMTLVGCGLYASMIGNGPNQAFSLLLLTATAGAVYWSQQRRGWERAGEAPFTAAGTGGAARPPGAVPDAPPAAQAPPEPGGSPSWWRDPLSKEPSYLWGPDDGPYGEQDRAAWKERKKAGRRERQWVFPLVVFLLAVTAAAVGAGASWPFQPAGVSAEIGLSAALAVLGAAFVVASFAGRARGGTVFWSLVVIAGLVGAAMVPKSGQGAGSSLWRPATAAAVQPLYERGAGRGDLDLTALALDGRTVTARLRIGAGQAEVRLPRDATVRIDYDLGLGGVVLPEKADGPRFGRSRHDTLDFTAPPGTVSRGTIDLEVTVGVGQLRVFR